MEWVFVCTSLNGLWKLVLGKYYIDKIKSLHGDRILFYAHFTIQGKHGDKV